VFPVPVGGRGCVLALVRGRRYVFCVRTLPSNFPFPFQFLFLQHYKLGVLLRSKGNRRALSDLLSLMVSNAAGEVVGEVEDSM